MFGDLTKSRSDPPNLSLAARGSDFLQKSKVEDCAADLVPDGGVGGGAQGPGEATGQYVSYLYGKGERAKERLV